MELRIGTESENRKTLSYEPITYLYLPTEIPPAIFTPTSSFVKCTNGGAELPLDHMQLRPSTALSFGPLCTRHGYPVPELAPVH